MKTQIQLTKRLKNFVINHFCAHFYLLDQNNDEEEADSVSQNSLQFELGDETNERIKNKVKIINIFIR